MEDLLVATVGMDYLSVQEVIHSRQKITTDAFN